MNKMSVTLVYSAHLVQDSTIALPDRVLAGSGGQHKPISERLGGALFSARQSDVPGGCEPDSCTLSRLRISPWARPTQ